MSDNVPEELIFFDSFVNTDSGSNLNLVQFTEPVYITEVRIIPLASRVKLNSQLGDRLGATIPGKFPIEFFVNNLHDNGASTFENVGSFEYDEKNKISLRFANDASSKRIPTDGLVLKGGYSTITLAVYGMPARINLSGNS